MAENLLHHYDRHDPARNYEKHLFRAGYVLQSAELNEIQSASLQRLKGVADALFKDGDIIRDAQVNVNQATGAVKCGAGAVYLRGAVRGVASSQVTIPVDKTVSIGIYLLERVVTELQDPALRDPASEVRNYQEPGAGRLEVATSWGWQAAGQADGQVGEFYPVYTADMGVLRSKSTPPQLDSLSQAIARYDRDSTGGDYVVNGLRITMLPDVNGVQQYSADAGTARVNGFPVDIPAARRLPYSAAPDIRFIDSEPWMSTTTGAQRITFDRTPVQNITQVRITAEKTAEIVHGSFLGSQDPLPNSSIVEIVEVKQGGTTYVQGVDYKLTGQKIDWSLDGAEPSIGSTYTAKYRYITSVTPGAVDETGYTVTGAVVGTLVQTSYNVKLPRVDRLCLTQEGTFEWVRGTSTDFDPVPPPVPNQFLPLAMVRQAWTAERTLQNDGLRVVPMKDLEEINERLNNITDMIAQQRLASDANARNAAAKKGMFVDPFLNDNQRDAGIVQSAAIVRGELVLPISAAFLRPGADITAPQVLNGTPATVLQQGAMTGAMQINPYQAYDPIPATVKLDPPADRFTITNTTWTSAATEVMTVGGGLQTRVSVDTEMQVMSSTTRAVEFLRPIDVTFQVDGLAPGEVLNALTFDGIAVTPVSV
ncbi:DUF4815 domain-containing protein [Duganella sp. FT92W]|uniref:DUF4815 domain-containing protein n=1 Tax=Pseudoduganella rivuli TaxID=2666085 RepID=A0A7X2LTX0_9BURK|nr:DUF4815 domain-containing protein [Pseudoduganella rivuli]MRV72269.1 DUF4815 domain-containing protein [Pseudoduganella rivuli]